MFVSRLQSTVKAIVVIASFVLFLLSPRFGYTESTTYVETPIETPTATPTPSPSHQLLRIQTLEIDSQSIGAIHPQTGDLYVGSQDQCTVFRPSSDGSLTRSGSRTIGWSFWDYITIAEDSSIFATSLHWEDFMAHSTNGKSYTLRFNPEWTGSLVHAVRSTDNIPGTLVGDVLILKHDSGLYNNVLLKDFSIWRVNYREQKVELFPFIPAHRLPPNIDDWTIGPENKLHFITSFPQKIFRLEMDGSIRELNHGHIPLPAYSRRIEYLPADGCFYVLFNEYEKTKLVRLSNDLQQWESVYCSDMIYYLQPSDVIAGKDGRTLYLLRPSVRKMDVLRYRDTPPTPTPTPITIEPAPIAGWFALNGLGEVRAIQSDIAPPTFPRFDTDIARDLEPDPKGRGWYLIDGYGNIYRTSDDLPLPVQSPIFNFDIVRNLEIKEKNGQSVFYILDGWGAVHTTDPDFKQQGLPYFPGEDIIRDMEPDPATDGWLTIDRFGHIYSTYGLVSTAEYARPQAYDIPFGRTLSGDPGVQAMVRLSNQSTIALDSKGNLFAGSYAVPYPAFHGYQTGTGESESFWDIEIIPEWAIPANYRIPTNTPTPTPTTLPEIAMTLFRVISVQNPIQSLHHDPDNHRLLIGKQNGELDVYNSQTWEFESRVNTGEDNLVSAFFSTNTKRIYTGFKNGTIGFYDISKNRLLRKIELNSTLHCMTIGTNPDVIYVGLDANQSVLIHGEEGKIIKRFFHYEGGVPTSAAIDRAGITLYLGTKDRIFQYNRLNQTVNVFEWPGIDIQMSPNEDRLWTLGKTLSLYDLSIQTTLTEQPVDGTILKVSPDGDIAAVGNSNGTLTIRHPDFNSLRQWKAHNGRVSALEFTQYGNGIISGGEDGWVRIWTHARENNTPTPTPTLNLPISGKTFFYEKVLADKQGLREAIAVQEDTGDIYVTALGILYRVKQPKNLFEDSIVEVVGNLPNGSEMNVETMAITSNGTILAADYYKQFLLIAYPNGNQKQVTFPVLDQNVYQTTIQSLYVSPIHTSISRKTVKKDDVLAVVYTQGANSAHTSRIWWIDPTQNNIEPEMLFETNSLTIHDITNGPGNRMYLLTNGSRRLYVLDDSGNPVEYTHFVFESLTGFEEIYPYRFTYLHGDRSFYLSASDCIFRLLGAEQNMYRIENLAWGEIADEIESSPNGEWLYYIDKGNHKLMGLKHKNPLPIMPVPTESPAAIPTATPIPGWMVLDGYGGLHLTNPNSNRPNLPYFINFDIVRDIEPDPLNRGWFMLDGYGGLHSSSSQLTKPDNMPYFAFDIARDIEFRVATGNTLYYYLLDGFGIIHTNDPSFKRGYLPTFTSDKARSLEPNPASDGWIVLDNEAIAYFDHMPWYDLPLNAKMRWDARAKSLIRFPDHRSIVLDGYGGQHTNSYYPPHETIQGLPESFYFPGWDIIWDVEIKE